GRGEARRAALRHGARDELCGEPPPRRARRGGVVAGDRRARAAAQRCERPRASRALRERGGRGSDPQDLAGDAVRGRSPPEARGQDRGHGPRTSGGQVKPGWNTWDRRLPGQQLLGTDPEIAALIAEETKRQSDHLELIASENFVSPAVLEAMGSSLTNKYAEGLPGKRYYGGCEVVDKVEQLAIDRAKTLFGADHANVQPHSGATANAAGYQ